MTALRRLWVPLLAGLLVTGVLGAGGGGALAVEPRTVVANVIVPPSAFQPRTTTEDFYIGSQQLWMVSGSGTFVAPVSFPVAEVRIRKITLYAYDNGTGQVGLELHRTSPATGAFAFQGGLSTTDAADDPAVGTTTDFAPRLVNTAVHGLVLELWLSDPSVRVYGVKVTYSYDA